jgi:hypothetical protein
MSVGNGACLPFITVLVVACVVLATGFAFFITKSLYVIPVRNHATVFEINAKRITTIIRFDMQLSFPTFAPLHQVDLFIVQPADLNPLN